MEVYSLFDRKLREFGALVLSRNEAAIRRSVLDGIRGTGSLVELHPEDFDLMVVGKYDVDVGVLTPVTPPRLVDNIGAILSAGKEVLNADG